MKLERQRVNFPLWRKKVDKSLLGIAATPIPEWACNMWGIRNAFDGCFTTDNPKSVVSIRFAGQVFEGWVTTSRAITGRRLPLVRLWFDENLKDRLRQTYLMSYMRSLEHELSGETLEETEGRVPFWEFLDIEFDLVNRVFHMDAHYKQASPFPHLFGRLVGSPNLQRVADHIRGKGEVRILKQDWKNRGEYRYELGAKNVIYLLADSKRRLLYVGEALDLVPRLNRGHSLIPNWDRFRYDVLPDALRPFRVHLERLVIRYVAALMPNGRGIPHIGISNYQLVNAKVDK